MATNESNITTKDKLEKLKQPVALQGKLPQDHRLITLLKGIPFLPGLIGNIDTAGSAVSKLVELTGSISKTASDALRGFQLTGIALDTVNFFRIPAIYLAAWILRKDLDQKLPFTLTNNAKWLYAGVLLGLALTAFLVPVVAPYIAIAGASLTTLVAAFTLGKLFYDRSKHEKELAALKLGIETDQAKFDIALNNINERAQKLDPNNLDAINALYAERQDLIKPMQEKLDKKVMLEAQLEKKGTSTIIDKAVGLILTGLVCASAITALFIPPIGLIGLASAGIVGASYIVSKVGLGVFSGLYKWLTKKPSDLSEEPSHEKVPTQALHFNNSNEHVDPLEINVEVLEYKSKIQDRIELIFKQDSSETLLQVFTEVAHSIEQGVLKNPNLEAYLDSLSEMDGWDENGKRLLNEAFKQHQESDNKNDLLIKFFNHRSIAKLLNPEPASPPVITVAEEQSLDAHHNNANK